jgi:signal transduction histidine kinase
VSADRATTQVLARLRTARMLQEKTLRIMRPLGPVVILLIALTAFRGHPAPGTHGEGLAVSFAVAAFIVGGWCALLIGDRQPRLYLAFAGLFFVSSAALMRLRPDGSGYFGLFIAVLLLTRRRQEPAVIGLGLLAVTAITYLAAVKHHSELSAILTGLVFAGLYVVMFLTRRLQEGNEQAERLLVELEQTRGISARAAALAERQRLAREVHDVLAHSLSGLLLQLEAARMLVSQDPADPRLAETIERACHLGKSGLVEARRAIGMLRDDDLPGPEQLATLTEQFEQDSGIPCRFAVQGEAHELGPQARLALYRVAQEALTNVTKHAQPDRVEVRLAYERDRTCLTIEDFGTPGQLPDAGGSGSYGLTGMRERAELLGGWLTATATAFGFRVELQVPG